MRQFTNSANIYADLCELEMDEASEATVLLNDVWWEKSADKSTLTDGALTYILTDTVNEL